MPQQLEFFLLESTDHDDFCTQVQRRLNDGWILHGSVFAFPDYMTGNKVESIRYLQAFLKDITQRQRTGFITGSVS